MAKQSSKDKAKPKNVKEERTYKSPLETWWGKTLIWVLVFGMVGVILVSLIVALVSGA